MRLRLRLRRRKPLPVRPAPPLKSPLSRFEVDADDAVTALVEAVRRYGTAPDDIPATIRADHAAGIAFGKVVTHLTALQARMDPQAQVNFGEREQRVLHSLVVNHGLQMLLSAAACEAELSGRDPRTAVIDVANDIHGWIDDATHLTLLDTE
jgi:hypothetical protein